MKEQEAKTLVINTARQLLQEGLLVRTWGNLSCRLDEDHFVITPSGMDYEKLTPDDLPVYDKKTDEWVGAHKPSSEKGIHAAAYALFADAQFVIHTHQPYATALSVYGFENAGISDEEKERLGGIALASYGLPGTKMLKNAVQKAMQTGAHAILMEKHGALLIGCNREDAYEKAFLLEDIARKNWLGKKYISDQTNCPEKKWMQSMIKNLRESYPNAAWVAREATVTWSKCGREVTAQLDDMAQMIGKKISVVSAKDPYTLEERVFDALNTKNAIMVKGFGAIVNGIDADDTVALVALVDKACICALHTRAAGVRRQLTTTDCELMHLVYQKKYSKLKK